MLVRLIRKRSLSKNIFWVYVVNKGRKICIAKYNFINFRNKELKINYFKLNYFLTKNNLSFTKSSLRLLQKSFYF